MTGRSADDGQPPGGGARDLGSIVVRAVLVGVISAVACVIAQRVVAGRVIPAVTAGVAGGVTAATVLVGQRPRGS